MSDQKVPGKRGGSGNKTAKKRTARDKSVRVKTARGRKNSSTRWLQRQLNDPYVREAQRLGYRSRAAFKLIELDEKLSLLRKNQRVVDLGAAPGGWCQVLSEREMQQVIAIDLLPIDPLPDITFMEMDFTDDDAPERLKALIGGNGKVDLVLSDMAANTIGHRQTDHLRMIMLVEMALDFAIEVLDEGGHFIAKTFQGGTEAALMELLKKHFKTVKHIKPKASRKTSPEQYICAMNFRRA
jgi:23S rRNA (uridine2552-2'-O)-methyltransferase